MERYEIIDKLDALYDEADKRNIGLNETELDYKESIVDWIQSLVKNLDLPVVIKTEGEQLLDEKYITLKVKVGSMIIAPEDVKKDK